MDWELGVNRCKLLPLEWISNEILLFSTGKGGEIQPISMKVGDKFPLPEYSGTKVVLDDKD